MKKRLLCRVIFLLAIIPLSGCVSSPRMLCKKGTNLAEIVTLKTDTAQNGGAKDLRRKISIKVVDGHFYESPLGNSPEIYYLSQGKHTFTVQWRNAYGDGASGQLWFVGEPGHTYVAKGVTQGYSISFLIEDQATHQFVGGKQGSKDEPNDEKR